MFRCGMTSWSSVTGAGNESDWVCATNYHHFILPFFLLLLLILIQLCRLIRGVIVLGAAPISSAYLSLVPVDFTARAMVYIGEHAEAHLKKNLHFDGQQLVAYSGCFLFLLFFHSQFLRVD